MVLPHSAQALKGVLVISTVLMSPVVVARHNMSTSTPYQARATK